MSQIEVYQQIQEYIRKDLPEIGKQTLKRLSLLVSGVMHGQNAAPRQMAEAIEQLSITSATAESIERRIRRSENAAEITAEKCYTPMIRALLERSKVSELFLIIDPTMQEDHIVMVSANLWYRGRTIPVAWTIWPGNVPLEGAGFWERIRGLLDEVDRILPPGIPVTVLADRAFGTPAFTDLVTQLGWHWIVRVQGQTVCRDRIGRERPVESLVRPVGERRKLAGQVFKKAGWRSASVVVFWGRCHYKKPLCLVSDLPPGWELIAFYRHRFGIEPTFRDYKLYGWRWEQGQVRNLAHVERLLVVMAIATCLTLLRGVQYANQILETAKVGKRTTRPWHAKYSLFRLGLLYCKKRFGGKDIPPIPLAFSDWHCPNWSTQFLAHYVHAFIFA